MMQQTLEVEVIKGVMNVINLLVELLEMGDTIFIVLTLFLCHVIQP